MVGAIATWDAAGTLILNYSHTYLLTKKNSQRKYPHHKNLGRYLINLWFQTNIVCSPQIFVGVNISLEEVSLHLQLQPLAWKASAAQM